MQAENQTPITSHLLPDNTTSSIIEYNTAKIINKTTGLKLISLFCIIFKKLDIAIRCDRNHIEKLYRINLK